jgi:hypothetical protein
LFALIDDADVPLVQGYAFYLLTRNDILQYASGYLLRSPDWRHPIRILLHTLITGWPYVDHADGDGLNCQRYNMREATQRQNSANSRKRAGASSQFKGVTWYKAGSCWSAQIVVNGHQHYLGYYLDEEDAARVYDRAAVTAWGAFAKTNEMLGLLPLGLCPPAGWSRKPGRRSNA